MMLLFNAILKFVLGFLIVGLLVFLPAGTINFLNGWVFMAVLFLPILIIGIVLYFKAPNLLKKRLNNKEKQENQKPVVALSGLIFVAGFVLAGLDFRFGWTHDEKPLQIIAVVLFLASYGLYAEIMRENAYLSRTIEVQENQKVVDTGLYGIVRHPMYAATIIMFLCIPIILGSYVASFVFALYPLVIAIRIKNEEMFLTEQLEGYSEYKKQVKYRIIPFVW